MLMFLIAVHPIVRDRPQVTGSRCLDAAMLLDALDRSDPYAGMTDA